MRQMTELDWVVVCHDCDFEETVVDRDKANQAAMEHAEENKHELTYRPDWNEPLETRSITTENVITGSVWVVAADMMEGGHPQVLGVYTNEDAAREHEQAIRDNGGCIKSGGYDHPVASFWTYEMPLSQSLRA